MFSVDFSNIVPDDYDAINCADFFGNNLEVQNAYAALRSRICTFLGCLEEDVVEIRIWVPDLDEEEIDEAKKQILEQRAEKVGLSFVPESREPKITVSLYEADAEEDEDDEDFLARCVYGSGRPVDNYYALESARDFLLKVQSARMCLLRPVRLVNLTDEPPPEPDSSPREIVSPSTDTSPPTVL